MKVTKLFFSIILLLPFSLIAQFDDCESALDNVTCGEDIDGEGEVGSTDFNFELDYYAFTALEDGEVFISYFWDCMGDGSSIDEFLDVYLDVFEECGGSPMPLTQGCNGGPTGEEATWLEVTAGVNYVIAVSSCEAFSCEYFITIGASMGGSAPSAPFELEEPELSDGCQDSDFLQVGEFCVEREIRFETTEPYFFPVHNWTVRAVEGGDEDDITWVGETGDSGNGSNLELYESGTEVGITFYSPGVYEVCIEEVQSSCSSHEAACVEVTIVNKLRFFDASACITQLEEGWFPEESEQGFSWVGVPITLEDLNDGGGYVLRELQTECGCNILQEIEFTISYPGDDGDCLSFPLDNCPQWETEATIFYNGVEYPNNNSVDVPLNDPPQLEFRLNEKQLPENGKIDWYRGNTSSFDPLAEGVLIGSSAITKSSGASDVRPELLAIMYDGPESYVLADDRNVETEYMIIGTGSGFELDELVLDLNNNCDNSCPANCFSGVYGEDCGWNGNIDNLFDPDLNVIGVGSGDAIPANSFLIVLLGSTDPDVLWNESFLDTRECIYVTQSDCGRCLEAFSNSGNEVEYSITTDQGESTLAYTPQQFGEGSFATREGYQNATSVSTLPAVLAEAYVREPNVSSFVYNPTCADLQTGTTIIYLKGVISGDGYELGCCTATTPTLTLYTDADCDEANALRWAPNSSSFLPPDFTITSADCPFTFGGDAFFSDIGSFWSVDNIVAQSTCLTNSGLVEYLFSHTPSSIFTEGETLVSITAMDFCGNLLDHLFTVTVVCDDGNPPPPPPPPSGNDEIFDEYPWLAAQVGFPDCEGTTVEVYQQGVYTYVYVQDGNEGKLYFQDGTLYCTDGPGFDCVTAYGFSSPVSSYDCEDGEVGPPPSGPDPSDDYPWMTQYIDFTDCEGMTIFFYQFGADLFPYFEYNGKMTLFSNAGQLYCTDSPPGFICPEIYGLGAPMDSWVCGGGCNCTADYMPVCGVDGISYSNACEADCVGVSIASQGECGGGPAPQIFDDYPWLLNLVDPVDCEAGTTVRVYRLSIYDFIYILEAGSDEGTLYNDQGLFYCGDSPGFSCLSAYNLSASNLVDEWVCGMSLTHDQVTNRSSESTSEYEKSALSFVSYPNPTRGQVTILVEDAILNEGPLETNVYDVSGQRMLNKVLHDNQSVLDLSALGSGVYFIELISKSQRVVNKVIVL